MERETSQELSSSAISGIKYEPRQNLHGGESSVVSKRLSTNQRPSSGGLYIRQPLVEEPRGQISNQIQPEILPPWNVLLPFGHSIVIPADILRQQNVLLASPQIGADATFEDFDSRLLRPIPESEPWIIRKFDKHNQDAKMNEIRRTLHYILPMQELLGG